MTSTTPRNYSAEPVSRAAFQSDMERHRANLQNWVLGAVALVAVHTVQFASLGLAWRGDRRNEQFFTGWDLVAGRFASNLQQASVLLLFVSAAVAFAALAYRNIRLLYVVMAASIVRAVLTMMVGSESTFDLEGWGARPGVVVAGFAAVGAAVVAMLVAPAVAD